MMSHCVGRLRDMYANSRQAYYNLDRDEHSSLFSCSVCDEEKKVLTTLIPEEATGNSCMTLFFSAAVKYLKKEKNIYYSCKSIDFYKFVCTVE